MQEVGKNLSLILFNKKDFNKQWQKEETLGEKNHKEKSTRK